LPTQDQLVDKPGRGRDRGGTWGVSWGLPRRGLAESRGSRCS